MSQSNLASNDPAAEEIPTVTGQNFDQFVLKGAGPIAVEFMSYSCKHCRALDPILETVAEMVKSKVKLFKVNIASDPALGDQYEIEGTPTLTMFLNGKKVGQIVGPNPAVSSVLSAVSQPFRLKK